MQQSTNHKKRVLVITPTPTHPQNAGNRTRTYRLLKEVEQCGYDVDVLYTGMEEHATHVVKTQDIEAMRKEWHTFTHLKDMSEDDRRVRPDIVTRLFAFIQRIDRRIGFMGQALEGRNPALFKKIKRFVPDNVFGLPQQKTVTNRGLDRWYPIALDTEVKKRARNETYDVVLIEYVFLSYAFRHFDNTVLKVLDTHDIFAGRDESFSEKGLRESFFTTSTEEENSGFDRADIILSIQEAEAEAIRARTHTPVVTLGHQLTCTKPEQESDGKTIGFFATGNTANKAALAYIVHKVFPVVQEKEAKVKLLVGGTVGEGMPRHDAIEYLGEVSNEAIPNMYARMDVVLNTTDVGTGLKIKFVEALSHGKATVSLPEAVAGFPEAETCTEVATKDTLAHTIVALLQDKKLRYALQERAYKRAQAYSKTVRTATRGVFDLSPPFALAHHGRNAKTESKFILFTWPRCGATSLLNILHAHKNIQMYDEPFHHRDGKQFAPEDTKGPYRYVKKIQKSRPGMKHNWGLTFEQNAHILLDRDHSIVFFPRKNVTQREVSLFIAQQTNWWDERTGNYTPPKQLPPINFQESFYRMREYRRNVKRYYTFLITNNIPFFECTYEDMFGPTVTKEKQFEIITQMALFLGYTYGPNMRKNETILNALDPDYTRSDIEDIYRLIPNIDAFATAAQRQGFGELF